MATFRTSDQDSNTYARYPVEVINKITTFDSTNGTTPLAIASSTTTTLGSRVGKILISSNDTAANIMKFYLHDGTTMSTIPFGFVAVPNDSGTGSDTDKPVVSVLRSTDFDSIVELDNNGNPYLLLQAGWGVYGELLLAPSAGAVIQVISWVDNY